MPVWSVAKRQIQKIARRAGYRIVPRERDAQSLRRWLIQRPIRTVIDVGASIGETATEWLKSFPEADVYAIEPLPTSFALLEKVRSQHVERLRTYNLAVGRTQGTVQFRVHPMHDTSSSLLQRTDYSASVLPVTKSETLLDVQLTTLDALFGDAAAAMKRDIMVKLDVQGAECDVLDGAARLLARTKYVYTEISLAPVYVGQSDFKTVHNVLANAGFALKGFVEQFHIGDSTPVYADVLFVNESI